MTKKQEQEDALARLRELVKPGDTLYTVLRGVSSSGMTRYIDVYKFDCDTNNTQRLTKSCLSYNMALAGLFSYNEKRDCISVRGCGMDMGHHVVYSLASALGYTRYHTKDGKDAYPQTNCYGLDHQWL